MTEKRWIHIQFWIVNRITYCHKIWYCNVLRMNDQKVEMVLTSCTVYFVISYLLWIPSCIYSSLNILFKILHTLKYFISQWDKYVKYNVKTFSTVIYSSFYYTFLHITIFSKHKLKRNVTGGKYVFVKKFIILSVFRFMQKILRYFV